MSQKKLRNKTKAPAAIPPGPIQFEFPMPWKAEMMSLALQRAQIDLQMSMIAKNVGIQAGLPGVADGGYRYDIFEDGTGMVGTPKVAAHAPVEEPKKP